MSVFNPQVAPTNDPNYFKYSEAVRRPDIPADKSSGIALTTAGTALEGAATLADSTVKGVIKDEIYQRTDPLQEGWLTALTNVANNPGTGNTPDNQLDLMAIDASVPPGLARGVANVQRIAAAEGNPHVNKTLIDQRLYSELKAVRSEYPGYREYIDQEMQKATGRNVANDLEASLRDTINRAGAQQKSEQEKWLSYIRSNSDLPGAPEVYNKYLQSGDSNAVLQWGNYNLGVRSMLSLKKAAMESESADKAKGIEKATDYAQEVVSHSATNGFYNMRFVRDEQSGAGLADTLSALSRNPNAVTDEQIQRLGQVYQAKKTEASNAAMAELFTKDPKTGKSVADRIGADNAKKMVEANINALFDQTSDLIFNKQWGLAYSNLNRATAVVNDQKMKILRDDKLGKQMATTAAINALGPNVAPQLLSKFIEKGLDQDLNAFISSQGAQAITQKDLSRGKPYTFSESIDELNKRGGADGKAFQSLANLRQGILQNEDMELKKNAIVYFYNQKNYDVVSKFRDDYYDPVSKRVVRGASAVYASLTAPEITKEIKSFADKGNPEVWRDYSNWAKTSFSTLFINSVNDLNDATQSQHFHISWNKERTSLDIVNANGTPLTGLQATDLNLPYRTITNLNEGLAHLKEVANTEGTNVDAFVFKTLRDAGFSPKKEIEGVPSQIMQALITGNTFLLRKRWKEFLPQPKPPVSK